MYSRRRNDKERGQSIMAQVTIGFVGLGTMGTGMVRNLLKAGFAVTGYNRTPERALPLVAAGMRSVASPALAVAGARFVVVAVSDDAAMRAVADGDDGLVGALSRGTVVINCGTHGLDLTAAIVADVRDKGAEYLDAPVTGSKLGADNATLTFMVGGASHVVESAKPLFSAMGKHVVHVGETPGLGQSAKYCLNMSQAVTLQGALEAWGLALRLGVSLEIMLDLFQKSAAGSGVSTFKGPYLMKEDYEPHFRLDLMQKDLHLAIEEASRRRLALPAASSVVGVYDQAAAEGLGSRDFLATATLLSKWLGVNWRPS
ncbi:MAG: NAD(P)-dependent oxidoreductase [Myxococcota bacterium]|nr:NAD(P)-dependent oxidoreductase [Myxococcota bacterium]